MRRILTAISLLGLVGAVWAQGTFSIRSPKDGQSVREVVTVRIPKNSIPESGYIGFWINGKFVEATVPTVSGADYVYFIDTKGRQIPDGKMTIQAKLFVDYNEAPKKVNETSVDVKLDNSTSIRVPAGGFSLRYKFVPGTELSYTIENRASIATLSEAQNKLGGRAAELPIEAEKFRYIYSIDGVDKGQSGPEGLIRMQPMPLNGKEYIYITLNEQTDRKKYMRNELAPVYMKMTDRGREIFGSIPFYVPFSGGSGYGSTTDLFGVFPMPILPDKKVKPGDVWQGAFQNATLNMADLWSQGKLTVPFLGRGVLEGLEWEQGRPCAKIKTTISQGTASKEGQRLVSEGRAFGDDKVTLEETYWFDLQRGVVLKLIRNLTIDRKVTAAPAGGTGGGPAGGPGANAGAPPESGAGMAGERKQDNVLGQGRGTRGSPMMGGQGGTRGGPRGGPGGFGNQGNGGRTASAAPATQYVRITQQLIFQLEK